MQSVVLFYSADGSTCTAILLVFASRRRSLSAHGQLGLQAPRDFQCSLAGAWLQTILFTFAMFVTGVIYVWSPLLCTTKRPSE